MYLRDGGLLGRGVQVVVNEVVIAKLENLIKILTEPPTAWQNLTELQREGLIDTAKKAFECIKKDGN